MQRRGGEKREKREGRPPDHIPSPLSSSSSSFPSRCSLLLLLLRSPISGGGGEKGKRKRKGLRLRLLGPSSPLPKRISGVRRGGRTDRRRAVGGINNSSTSRRRAALTGGGGGTSLPCLTKRPVRNPPEFEKAAEGGRDFLSLLLTRCPPSALCPSEDSQTSASAASASSLPLSRFASAVDSISFFPRS